MFADIGGIPAIMQSGGDHDKGMGASGMWVFALIVLVFIALFGLNGTNKRDEGRNSVAEIAALNAAGGLGGANAQTAAFTELNGRLDGLSQQISHVNDRNDIVDLKRAQAEANMNTTQQAFNLSTQIANNRTDNLLSFKDAALQLANCCCDIRTGQDQLRFEAAQNTCNIMNNDNANTQRIVDKITESEIARLNSELAEARLANSQCAQNAYLINTLRPYPIPSFGTFNPTLQYAVG